MVGPCEQSMTTGSVGMLRDVLTPPRFLCDMLDTEKLDAQKPGVGVAAVVWRDESRQELLVGLGHSPENRSTTYAVPGGHWESGETLAEAVARETFEEAAIRIADISLVSVYEFFNQEKRKSYVTIGFSVALERGVPRVVEGDRKTSWEWMEPRRALELPLFEPDAILISRVRSGPIYG